MKDFDITDILNEVSQAVDKSLGAFSPLPETEEIGRVQSVAEGVVWATGMTRVKYEEQVSFENGDTGIVIDILPDRVGIALFGTHKSPKAGEEITRSHAVLEIPVGDAFIGRIINPLGEPLDGMGPVSADDQCQVFKEAPKILDRQPVDTPLQTGLKVVDALIPIGRGQRELILGDRQTGKTAIAVDTIINQKDKNVICVYCAIGQRSAGVAKVIADLKEKEALTYTLVVVVEGNDPPGLQYLAPYAATTLAEYFMENGQDVLIVYDDLTRHALAYRQLSLLLRRPPGREAFPGDIFYIHAQLLERATHLKADLGGGSLTALPIAETEAQNISAYIPTNLISITDGQLYLSPDLFQKGVLPAVDVGKSVSRVGGKAQVPAYQTVSGDLKLSYTQFQELESFARFGTRLDENTRKTLAHGARVREALKQDQFSPLSTPLQIAILYAVTKGHLENIQLDHMAAAETAILDKIKSSGIESDAGFLTADAKTPLWKEIEMIITEAITEFRNRS